MSKSKKEKDEFIKKQEQMIRGETDPLSREKNDGGKPNKKYGGENFLNSIKERFSTFKREGFSAFKREGFSPDDARKKMNQKPSEKDKEKAGLGAKFGYVGFDLLQYIAILSLSLYISISWLQLTRSFNDHRMFPGMDPNITPYTSIGSVQGTDRYNYSILSMKRFIFPYNMRDRINHDTWINNLLDHFRDTWRYAKENGDWWIGMLEPLALMKDTRTYKEDEKSIIHMIFEFMTLFVWLPILVLLVFVFGATFIPLYASFKSYINVMSKKSLLFKIFGWWLFGLTTLPGTIFNIGMMPIYLFYFIYLRPWNFISKGGIKDWAQYIIGKYYMWIFVCIMFAAIISVSYHMSDEKVVQPMVMSIIGIVTVFMILLVYFEKLPAQIGRVDQEGNKIPFRIPGEEKLNSFRYPKPATIKVKPPPRPPASS